MLEEFGGVSKEWKKKKTEEDQKRNKNKLILMICSGGEINDKIWL